MKSLPPLDCCCPLQLSDPQPAVDNRFVKAFRLAAGCREPRESLRRYTVTSGTHHFIPRDSISTARTPLDVPQNDSRVAARLADE
jgi:hypothetical protein